MPSKPASPGLYRHALEATTMNNQIAAPVPEAISQLQRRLEQLRSSQSARTKLPESLWKAAVELAQRLGGMSSQPKKQEKPAFVELLGEGAAASPESCR